MYRLKSNFDDTWNIETEVERPHWFYDPDTQQNKHEMVKVWESQYGYRNLSYSAAKKEVERRIAEAAFVPVILVPPLPDRDPTLPPRNRCLGIF